MGSETKYILIFLFSCVCVLSILTLVANTTSNESIKKKLSFLVFKKSVSSPEETKTDVKSDVKTDANTQEPEQKFKNVSKAKSQCLLWKSNFSRESYNLRNLNPMSLTKDSPNVKTLGEFCGLGEKIMQNCKSAKDILGIYDPKYPDPTACDDIDCSTAVPDSKITYAKLCKSMQCTINNSNFRNYEWNLAAGEDGDVSKIYDKNGSLKFNIYSANTNSDFIYGFCDLGRQMLADENCSKDYKKYVSQSNAFKFYCCNDKPCCPKGGDPSCVGPPCEETCTEEAASCVTGKGEFVSSSWSKMNFNDASLDIPENVDSMLDYCSFGNDVIDQNCSVDKYHPLSTSPYIMNPQDTDPKSPAKLYSKYCKMNPACLKKLGEYKSEQSRLQKDAYPVIKSNDQQAFINSISSNDENNNQVINSNGESLINFCENGDSLYNNKCFDNYNVDPNNESDANYPPIEYDPTYLGLCCINSLGKNEICDRVNTVEFEKYTKTMTGEPASLNKDFYRYFKNRNIKPLLDA